MGHGKAHLGVGRLGGLYKGLQATLRSQTPHADDVGAGLKQRLVILGDGVKDTGLVGADRVGHRAEARVDVGAFHIDAADGSTLGGGHCRADAADPLHIVGKDASGGRRGKNRGGAALQMLLSRLDRVVDKANARAGMAVDVHKTGADVGALGVDDLAALGDGGGAHLAEPGDLAVLHEQHRLRKEVVAQNQFRVNNSKHRTPPIRRARRPQ